MKQRVLGDAPIESGVREESEGSVIQRRSGTGGRRSAACQDAVAFGVA
jgi:hypothetical protein